MPGIVVVMGSSSELEQSLPPWNSLTGEWSGKKEINVQVNDILLGVKENEARKEHREQQRLLF